MTLQHILSQLDGVKPCAGGYIARCPAHDDRHQSLSISTGKDGRVLLNCHAGCSKDAIVRALGLSMKDLFEEPKRQPVALYQYPGGAQKLRFSDKSFAWRQPDGKGGWRYSRKGLPHSLYVRGEMEGIVFLAEGEKDVDSLFAMGLPAASGEDGAGPGKWKPEYSQQLKGQNVFILPDNDPVGRDYAQECAESLHGVAASVRVCDLKDVWPEIPVHGDVSDLIASVGQEEAEKRLARLMKGPEWKPGDRPPDPLLALFKPLQSFPEEEAKWLVPGWIPQGQISVMAADGGIGKTTLWCHLIAALSRGGRCVLDPPGVDRKPCTVLFLTTEDSVRKKLRRKLRLAGADMGRIFTPDFSEDKESLLRDLKFGSTELERVLKALKPDLCVFDPVQGFVPPKVNMGSRNEMRDCLSPLVTLGEEVGTTSLIICHTNKRKGAFGRDRVADSADIWDIARSVMMAGFTDEQGIRYLSNEKNNYDALQETILFTIDKDEQITKTGSSWKRDREFTQGAEAAKSPTKREDCKEWILHEMDEHGGDVPSKVLEECAAEAGYSYRTLIRAKKELKEAGEISLYSVGNAKDGNREWRMKFPSDIPTWQS